MTRVLARVRAFLGSAWTAAYILDPLRRAIWSGLQAGATVAVAAVPALNVAGLAGQVPWLAVAGVGGLAAVASLATSYLSVLVSISPQTHLVDAVLRVAKTFLQTVAALTVAAGPLGLFDPAVKTQLQLAAAAAGLALVKALFLTDSLTATPLAVGPPPALPDIDPAELAVDNPNLASALQGLQPIIDAAPAATEGN